MWRVLPLPEKAENKQIILARIAFSNVHMDMYLHTTLMRASRGGNSDDGNTKNGASAAVKKRRRIVRKILLSRSPSDKNAAKIFSKTAKIWLHFRFPWFLLEEKHKNKQQKCILLQFIILTCIFISMTAMRIWGRRRKKERKKELLRLNEDLRARPLIFRFA